MWLSNLLIMRVPDEDYTRHAWCTLNLIYVLFLFSSFFLYLNYDQLTRKTQSKSKQYVLFYTETLNKPKSEVSKVLKVLFILNKNNNYLMGIIYRRSHYNDDDITKSISHQQLFKYHKFNKPISLILIYIYIYI